MLYKSQIINLHCTQSDGDINPFLRPYVFDADISPLLALAEGVLFWNCLLYMERARRTILNQMEVILFVNDERIYSFPSLFNNYNSYMEPVNM